MIASEFEAHLLVRGFYFENPGVFVPGVDKDAEAYTAEQLMDILTHEGTDTNPTGNFLNMVRRRSEQMGYMTYYFKDEAHSEYFKVAVPTSTNAGAMIDLHALLFTIKQSIDTVKVRWGMW